MVAMILDAIGVPTPKRIEVNRDGGPKLDPRVAEQLMKELGIDVNAPKPYQEAKMKNEDVLVVGNKSLEKSYVEKPVSGEDHNVWIYFSKRRGGGGRRLFRKVCLNFAINACRTPFQIGNKSSEFDPNMSTPREEGSYVYEKFMDGPSPLPRSG
jgi:inositol hexakisphosphate/diphosphoinositol-pentakisphosphate kinase